MATDKIQTGIRLEQESLDKLRFIAKENKRSLNSLVEFLVDQEIKQFEKENGVIVIEENLG